MKKHLLGNFSDSKRHQLHAWQKSMPSRFEAGKHSASQERPDIVGENKRFWPQQSGQGLDEKLCRYQILHGNNLICDVRVFV